MLTENIFNSRNRLIKTALVFICVSFIFLLGLFQAQNRPAKSFVGLNFGSLTSSSSVAIDVQHKCRPWLEWTQSYRRCVAKYLQSDSKRSAWRNAHEAQTKCAGQSTFDMMNVNYLPNKDDVKLVILPLRNENSSNSECIEVTLGVGNDIESEEKLLELLPSCQMYGADPIHKVGRIFEKIGQYYEMAVGAVTGTFNASVLVGPGIWDYATKAVPTTAFVDFLKNNVKHTKIDYLFMDNEGAEYDILPLYFGPNSDARINDIVVCQISVEMHGPLANYGMTNDKYNELMRNILNSSPFIPLWSTAPANHVRMFLLNANDDYCVEKYLQKWCFTNF